MPEPVLRVRGVSKFYGAHRVLNDVSVDLRAGRVTGLIGVNGAGKTTLIRLMTGLLSPDEGAIVRAPAFAGHIGYLPEERGLYLRQPAVRTLTYLGELRGMTASAAGEHARRWLDLVELPDGGRRPLEQYSKGQQQKAQLAAAFLGDPSLVILDEPFAGLDPINVRVVLSLVGVARERGAALLLSAHQLNLVEAACDEAVMLDRGRIVLSQDLPRADDATTSLEALFVANVGETRGQ
jgi:ABC-2 type transport system ATP-binding protein